MKCENAGEELAGQCEALEPSRSTMFEKCEDRDLNGIFQDSMIGGEITKTDKDLVLQGLTDPGEEATLYSTCNEKSLECLSRRVT